AKLLGVVLNGVDRRVHYRRYYRYYARSEEVDNEQPIHRKLIPLLRGDSDSAPERGQEAR
nr:hypothetical protein [Pseudomonadota bacterium]